ncbi:MAG TPA: peptidylprolyl isomerase [Candidatus Nanoarchaeia archaeon]|nr:peptidylprolyl isomerase [Candidatus Nanoarchaeia archaeon]
MAEKVLKNDFIELSYTGRLADGTVFDTTEKNVAEQNHLPIKDLNITNLIICIGENQVLPGLDKELAGKNIGQQYEVSLAPEQAFGKRDIKKMKIVPMSTFIEHKVQPQPGLQIDVDGQRGLVVRVSGGRIIVNFNHFLAGREVLYTYRIIRKITAADEKISAYLANMLQISGQKIEVKVEQEKAEVSLPLEFPMALTEILTKKLMEITGMKGITFRKLESSQSKTTVVTKKLAEKNKEQSLAKATP